MQQTVNYNKDIKLMAVEYDVVVCGGGPAGVAAALASARAGAETLLVEAQGQLGGMSTSGIVSHWLGGRMSDGVSWAVGGIFKELTMKAVSAGFAKIPLLPENDQYSPHGWDRGQLCAGIPFDPYKMSVMLEEEVLGTGIALLLKTSVIDTIVQNGEIQQIVVNNKSGVQAISGKVFIDATGDADLADMSGCKIVTGREGDGLAAPATLQMHVYGVNTEKLSRYIHEYNSPRFLKEIEQWRQDGEWDFSYDRFISAQLDDDTYMINTSRLCDVDGTDGTSITDAMVRGRKENLKLLDIMKKRVPGFEQVKLKSFGTCLGVRETRRIVADYVMTVQDICSGKYFDDVIGYSSYYWDLPDPKRPSVQPMENGAFSIHNDKTPLPFRIMIAQGVKNIICPGRAVSVERDVLGPVRVMAPCMAMGEAAGYASSMIKDSRDFKKTDITELKNILKNNNAII